MSRILVLIGHPISGSYNHALAARYVAGLGDAAEVRVIDLATASFPHDPISREDLRFGDEGAHLDPAIAAMIEDVRWAEHLVIFFPQWWGTYPAALKAFIDRVFLSGSSFRYGKGQISTRLLRGRTARIVMTMDSPRPWNRWVYRNAAETSLRAATLNYVGITVSGITRFTSMRFSTPEQRAGWLEQVGALATKDLERTAKRATKAASGELQPA
jgi:putative NADPH-quinone reductase